MKSILLPTRQMRWHCIQVTTLAQAAEPWVVRRRRLLLGEI